MSSPVKWGCRIIVRANFQRCYSDFLGELPRVGGAVSSFGKRERRPDVGLNSKKVQNDVRLQGSSKKNVQPKTSNVIRSKIERHNYHLKIKEKLKKIEKNENQSKMGYSKMNNVKTTTNKEAKDLRSSQKINLRIPSFISVSNLASTMNVSLNSVFKKLDELGFDDIRHNYILDQENASLIAEEFNFFVDSSENAPELDLFPDPVNTNLLKERPPVVTIMGHVDHGKTTILDYLRKSSIVNKEFGGITQHIGAFSVTTPLTKKKITFMDTPGHAAFLKMRERGAIITDIIILVVAVDDSVMSQTVEAIKHAKRVGVPMIVVVNKCDKPGANIDKVLADVSNYGIDIEDYGGDTQTVCVAGKTGYNMDKLEESIVTLSELMEFKTEFNSVRSEGWIIESQVEKGMGIIATVLVRRGSVKLGDVLVAGTTYCKVRGMRDENKKSLKNCGPSTPVQVWGWKDIPESGDQALQAKDEKLAKKVVEHRISKLKEIRASRDIDNINRKRNEEMKELKRQEKINEMKMAGLDPAGETDKEESVKKLNYIVKADVYGSAEAIKESIDNLGNDEVKSLVVSHSAGSVTESDISLAKALDASILSFNNRISQQIYRKADQENVKLIEHNVIYHLIEDVTEELTSCLKPIVEERILGEVEIKNVFTISGKNKSKTKVAGCKVNSGSIKRSSKVKVTRNGEVLFNGLLSSLKHVKNDISETKKGSECGLTFDHWDKFDMGDKVEVYEEISHPRFL